jgi:hypothetical protein
MDRLCPSLPELPLTGRQHPADAHHCHGHGRALLAPAGDHHAYMAPNGAALFLCYAHHPRVSRNRDDVYLGQGVLAQLAAFVEAEPEASNRPIVYRVLVSRSNRLTHSRSDP